MSDWQTTAAEIVYETPWFKIHRDQVHNHNGKLLTYSYLALHHPTVHIVAVDAEGKTLLQRNFRYTIGKTLWELPAGHSDGEEPLTAARRELMEETGLASDTWTNLGRFYSVPGVAKMLGVIFMAENVHPAAGERDRDEQITDQTFFSLEQIESMIRDGQIEESGVIAALYTAKLHRSSKEEK